MCATVSRTHSVWRSSSASRWRERAMSLPYLCQGHWCADSLQPIRETHRHRHVQQGERGYHRGVWAHCLEAGVSRGDAEFVRYVNWPTGTYALKQSTWPTLRGIEEGLVRRAIAVMAPRFAFRDQFIPGNLRRLAGREPIRSSSRHAHGHIAPCAPSRAGSRTSTSAAGRGPTWPLSMPTASSCSAAARRTPASPRLTVWSRR